MPEQDPLLQHEALHVTNLILDMIETHIQDHQYYGSAVNQLFSMHVDDAMLALRKAYQSIHQ